MAEDVVDELPPAQWDWVPEDYPKFAPRREKAAPEQEQVTEELHTEGAMPEMRRLDRIAAAPGGGAA